MGNSKSRLITLSPFCCEMSRLFVSIKKDGTLALSEEPVTWVLTTIDGATQGGCTLQAPGGLFAELDWFLTVPFKGKVRLAPRSLSKRQIFVFKRVH